MVAFISSIPLMAGRVVNAVEVFRVRLLKVVVVEPVMAAEDAVVGKTTVELPCVNAPLLLNVLRRLTVAEAAGVNVALVLMVILPAEKTLPAVVTVMEPVRVTLAGRPIPATPSATALHSRPVVAVPA